MNKFTKMNTAFVYVIVLVCVVNEIYSLPFEPAIEEAILNFTGLGFKFGYPVEEHEVTTEDGFILQLFRIPGKSKKPVLLMHGLTDCADTFIIRGNRSIAISLADAAYDVWAGNIRGNRYSRGHIKLTDKDDKFWDYSFHEGGYYDLPAMIDYILETTGQKQLQTIGHSQGTTMHFVLLSMRPEYNEKIKLFIALAPVAFIADLQPPVADIVPFGQRLGDIFKSLRVNTVFPEKSPFTALVRAICRQGALGYRLCYETLFFPLLGYDTKRFEVSFLKTAIGHSPGATSVKSLLHYDQLAISKRFCQYDYGPMENSERYGYTVPPDYNLREVSVKVAMIVGKNDPLSRIKDVELLRMLLPNVVYYHVMKSKRWNHIDFVLANDAPVTILPHILRLLKKYE